MRLKLLACEIIYRELCMAVARSVHQVDVEFLPKGLHDIGQAGMSSRLADVLANVDETRYEAILLGYGLCSNGLVGLAARSIPLVVPRAHDCITLFLGSKERYLEYFQSHPGVYFKTSGWIERGFGLLQAGQDGSEPQSAKAQSYEDLVARYGEDNAKLEAEVKQLQAKDERKTGALQSLCDYFYSNTYPKLEALLAKPEAKEEQNSSRTEDLSIIKSLEPSKGK